MELFKVSLLASITYVSRGLCWTEDVYNRPNERVFNEKIYLRQQLELIYIAVPAGITIQ